MPALSERDMRVLAFERGTWRTAGAKEQAIAEVLGITATRYYQLLNELIDTPEALRFDPTLVKRLRAQRARRQRVRSPKPPGALRPAAGGKASRPGRRSRGGRADHTCSNPVETRLRAALPSDQGTTMTFSACCPRSLCVISNSTR
jgi:Protein of unknown function (DUF3263)